MSNKNTIKNNLIKYSGYGYLKWKYRPYGLYCFNYHRIGHSEQTRFNPNVFSCTKEMFDEHLQFYKLNFEVINIDQLIQLIDVGKPLKKHYALITFDDGYKDNYDDAFPVLKKHNLPAVFFVPTDYIESNKVPWWDEIAWMIKQCDLEFIQLHNWENKVFIDKQNIEYTLRKIISEIKKNREIPIENVLKEISEHVQLKYTESDNHLFMSWNMLKEMAVYGMNIGSHGCSHKILSSLLSAEQSEEIKTSKIFIESKIDVEVKAFAYPEGGANTYNNNTIEALKKVNYKLGFNFIPGINLDVIKNNFDIKRLSVCDNCPVDDLKYSSVSFL